MATTEIIQQIDPRIKTVEVRGSPRYMVESRAGGKRQRQFFKRYDEAQKALKEIDRDAQDLGRAYRALPAHEKASVMAILNEIETSGMTLAEVWSIAKSGGKPVNTCSLDKALRAFLLSKIEANRRSRTVNNLERYLCSFIEGREHELVSSLGAEDLRQWFRGRGESPQTRKLGISILSNFFGFCQKREWIVAKPTSKLDAITVPHKPPQFLTVEQSISAINWTKEQRPEYLAWFVLALFAGLRPEAEADRMTWDRIDLGAGIFRIEESKTQSHNRNPRMAFCAPLAPWLAEAKKLNSKLPVTLDEHRRLQSALGAHLGFDKWPQDVLRHTAATYLLAWHEDYGKVAFWLGNSPQILKKHYDGRTSMKLAERWLAIMPDFTLR